MSKNSSRRYQIRLVDEVLVVSLRVTGSGKNNWNAGTVTAICPKDKAERTEVISQAIAKLQAHRPMKESQVPLS